MIPMEIWILLERIESHRLVKMDQVRHKIGTKHFTADIKNEAILIKKKHLTVHGYLQDHPTLKNMWDIEKVEPKMDAKGRPKKEKDKYDDLQREIKLVNN